MSGDVQPRKRKDKRRKKEDEDAGTPPPTLVHSLEHENVTIHIHKDGGTGGHWCARIIFFALLTILVGLIGIIILEHRGTTDVDTPVAESRWATIFDGWVDDTSPSHDESAAGHDDEHEEHSEEADDHDDEQEEEQEDEEDHDEEDHDEEDHEEEEENESEEVAPKDSKEDEEEDEGIGSQEEEDEEETEEHDGGEVSDEDQLDEEASKEKDDDDHDNKAEPNLHESDDEGFAQSDEENDDTGTLEEVDNTSGEENDSVDQDDQDVIHESDNELDMSIEGVKASGEEQLEDEASEEFMGIPGVNEIDDNSAEPLEEIVHVVQDLEYRTVEDLDHEANDNDDDSRECSESDAVGKIVIRNNENENKKVREDFDSVSHDLDTLEKKSDHEESELSKNSVRSPKQRREVTDQSSETVPSCHRYTENWNVGISKLKLNSISESTEEDNAEDFEDFADKDSVSSEIKTHLESNEESDESKSIEEKENLVTEVETLAKAQFCEKPEQCRRTSRDLKIRDSSQTMKIDNSLDLDAFEKYFRGEIKKVEYLLKDDKETARSVEAETAVDFQVRNECPGPDKCVEESDFDSDELIKVEDEEPEEVINEAEIEPEPEEIEEESTGVAVKFGVGVALVVAAHFVLVRRWNNAENESGVPDLSRRNTIVPPPRSIEQIASTVDAGDQGQKLEIQKASQTYEDLKSKYKSLETEGDTENVFAKTAGLRVENMSAKDIWAERSPAREELKSLPKDSAKETSDEEEEEPETSEGERISGTEEDEDEEEEEDEVDDVDDSDLVAKLEAKYGKLPTPPESEVEDEEEEEEEEEEEQEEEEEGLEEDEEEDDDIQGWKRVKAPKESQSESDEEPKPVSKPMQKGKQGGGAKDIEFISISNPDDVIIREDVHSEIVKAEEQVKYFSRLLAQYPKSIGGQYRLATALHELSKQTRNVNYLRRSIGHYENVIDSGAKVPQEIFKVAVENCLKNMRLLEQHEKAERIHQALIERFPSEPSYRNELTITYLIQNKWKLAKEVLEVTLSKWPQDGVALVHYGFILKINFKNMPDAVRYLKAGIESGEEGTADGRFYFQLGDALARLGKQSEALKVYNEGAQKGLFLSAYQRSLYFVPRLTGRPWWTLKETTYERFFESLEENWKIIKAEGQAAFLKRGSFKKEQENLVDVGVWKEFQLYARGRRNEENCKEAPRTCSLVSQFPPAAQCRRGQTKFSVMTPNTHVWPHCGPSNDRLRSHLGLHGLQGAFLRVANETREWRDGKIIVFDDSFEHEVWHNGSSYRLVLIVDVWHPEITAHEKKTLPEL